MTARTIFTDDHDNTDIPHDQAESSTAGIIARRADRIITWDALNLSEASFAELVEVLGKFCPDVQPVTNDRFRVIGADDEELGAELSESDARELVAQNEGSRMERIGLAVTATPAPRRNKTSATSERNAAIRAWWKGLTPDVLKALSLSACETDRGPFPKDVIRAYDAAHSE